MAGDWIALQKDLPKRLEVMRISEATGLGRHEVLGMLLEFWIWADSETADGMLPGIGTRSLATFWRHLGDTGETFCRALVAVGWLAETPGGLLIPKFERWMGASAKRRLQKNLSKQHNRALRAALDDATGPQTATSDVATPSPPCRPEKRESINTPPPPPGGGGVVSSRPGGGVPGPEDDPDPDAGRGDTLDQARGVRPITASDRPDLYPAAQAVVAHYVRLVRPTARRDQVASSRVVALLAAGHTADQLRRAADRYAASMDAADIHPSKRRAAHNFFGAGGDWESYLKDDPPAARHSPPPIPPREVPTGPVVIRPAKQPSRKED